MARPRLPPRQRKSHRIFVRLSPEQLGQIKRKKDAAGMRMTGISTYVRELVLRAITGPVAKT